MAMEFDEYRYLEKSLSKEESPPAPSADDDGDRRSSRRHHLHRGDHESSGEKEKEKEKDRHRGTSDRDRDRHRRERDRDNERERENKRERERRREKEKERERERERRSSSGSRRHEREVEREVEREYERERRSSSRSRRHEREVEREYERGRSRDRAIRERELERDLMDSRKSKDKKESVESEVDLERDQRTVFAYQMPLRATERDVYEFFSKAGKVRDVRLIMDRNSRRSKGVGYVEFYDVLSVPMAIALSGQLLLGQPVMVKPSEAEKNLVPSTASVTGVAAARKIYVGNLDYNITEDMLRQVFESFGPVEVVQLPREPETGHCKGYGFIQFAQAEHAKAAQTLNEKVQIAGRYIKVSSVTDHVNVGESATNADLDDDEGGSLSLNAHARALLMQKLDRTGTASSIVGSLGVPVLNGAVANQPVISMPIPSQTTISVFQPLASPLTEPIGQPSECVLLKNMFDPSTETEPDFDLDIKEEVEGECSKFGQVKHIYVDKNSKGHVYLRFDSVGSASNCQRAMHGRWYARRCISALYMRPQEYEVKFHGSY